MGVVRLIGQAARGIELAVRGAKPALRRSACADRCAPWNTTSLPSGANTPQDQEQIGVCRSEDETNSLAASGPGDLERLAQRHGVLKVTTVARWPRSLHSLRPLAGGLSLERRGRRVKIKA